MRLKSLGQPGGLSLRGLFSIRILFFIGENMTDSSGMNRRDFIGKSAAAIAGTMVVPGSGVVLLEDRWSERSHCARTHWEREPRPRPGSDRVEAEVQPQRGDGCGVRFVDGEPSKSCRHECGILRADSARGAASAGIAGHERCRCGAHLDAGTFPFSDSEDGGRGPARTRTWKNQWETCFRR